MTSFNSKAIILALIVALVGFVVIHFLSLVLSSALAFALGAVVSGIVILAFSKPAGSAEVDATNVETKTLYVGNLPYRANEHMVKELFSEHGKVFGVRLLKDKNTGKRRGFGFVEVAEADADTIISKLNDNEYQDRTLKVREAKQKQEND